MTSTLVRTHQTLAPFLDRGLAWEQFSEIDEMNWGDHEGKPGTPEMIAQYQHTIAEWKKENYDIGISGGETAQQLADRMARFVAQLRNRPESTILVCSHGRAMRCMITLLREAPLFHMEEVSHMAYHTKRLLGNMGCAFVSIEGVVKWAWHKIRDMVHMYTHHVL